MTSTVTKSKASDFGGLFNGNQMRDLIEADATITTVLLHIIVTGDVIDMIFGAALSGAESTALDTIISNYTYVAPTPTVTEVKIMEEEVKTGGRYRLVSHRFTAAASTTTTSDLSFPYDINVVNGVTEGEAAHKLDTFSVHVSPGTTIGTLTADATDTDTTVTVGDTVLENTFVGGHVDLTDGTNTTALLLIVGKDTTAKTLTMSTAIGHNFTAATPTYVRFTRVYADTVCVGSNQVDMGGNKIGATYIPKNTVIRFLYTNTQASPREVCCTFQYLF